MNGDTIDVGRLPPRSTRQVQRRRAPPILAWIGEPLDFDAVLDDIAMKVEQAIQVQGRF